MRNNLVYSYFFCNLIHRILGEVAEWLWRHV